MAAHQTVLDLGCNNGYGTRILSTKCKRTVGVDVSERAIKSAKRTNADTEIEFHVIDGKTLPFDDHTFDMVVSFQVIEHLTDLGPYLQQFRRVLKLGGTALFTTPNREIRLNPGMKPWNPFHVCEYNAEQLEEILAGFFPEVKIEDLFANSDLYAIELDRVQRIRDATLARRRRGQRYARNLRNLKIRIRTMAIKSVKAVLPNSLVQMIRKSVRQRECKIGNRGMKPEIGNGTTLADCVARWSLEDLYYKDDNLSEALDLMAVCRSADCDQCFC